MNKILIIDDEDQLRSLLARILGLEGYEIFQANCCKSGLKQLAQCDPDVVLCDVRMPDGNGVDLICKIKEMKPQCEVILLTAHGNIPDGVQAIKNGAFDYITKGDDNNKIIPLVSRAVEKIKVGPKANVTAPESVLKFSFDTILGKSKAIQDVIQLAKKVSRTDVPVLLTGETGTGKEVFAQAIHQSSLRASRSFVAINCAAFSKELLDSEMFGHRAGSFTGAMKDKKGLFEEADNGTIFLDEIGEMAFDLQAKLLRVLESGEFLKIGDTKSTQVNVRIIAATNRDLKKEIENGNFREDLFYRLSVFHIYLPPLRERPEDIELYTRSFAYLFASKMQKTVVKIDPAYLLGLQQYQFRGNIRELRNIVERSIIIMSGDTLQVEDLPIDLQKSAGDDASGVARFTHFELAEIEKSHIQKILRYTSGNKTETARLLKIGLTTLYRKIEEYGLV